MYLFGLSNSNNALRIENSKVLVCINYRLALENIT